MQNYNKKITEINHKRHINSTIEARLLNSWYSCDITEFELKRCSLNMF